MNFNRDVKQFHRRIKLRSHFGITESPNLTEKIFNKSNSTWEPKEIHHTVNTFIEDFTQKINNSLQEQRNIKWRLHLRISHANFASVNAA